MIVFNTICLYTWLTSIIIQSETYGTEKEPPDHIKSPDLHPYSAKKIRV